ncbi:GDP-L-fucose synthase [Enhydrobacter aerosaccus]|uniref:GDP-L-fucose synthase n=1 Tax=Enhydrobacter aerosaccus TaxID=225324 RepID=A0A1T4KIX6_9HYPH|nr:NAD(P)-dependent oxidoreductase [Enhydrobacter aerosaccus]SJZ42354.1 GDP-L-fucose synthase [Enhydrobacter aerosaccus]
MTIAVLGATGLVGRYLVEALAEQRSERLIGTFRHRPPYDVPQIDWMQCDLRQTDAAKPVLEKADCAVLCAGQLATSSVLQHDPVTPIVDTLRIVTNVLEAAAAVRVPRFVLVSSCTVYPALSRPAVESDAMTGEPQGQWFGVGSMHRYGEQQLRWYVERLQRIGSGIVLRPTLVYGRYDDFSPQTGHFVPTLISKVVDRVRPIEIWGNGEQSRNLLHGADLAQAVLAALDADLPTYATFNVVSPDDVTVNRIVRELVDLDGFIDADIRHDLARGGGPSTLAVSGSAFGAATGWKARTGLREGLSDAVAWYRQANKS